MGYKFTECLEGEHYRYVLRAETDCQDGGRLVIVQCNPSVASANRSDPTAGKVLSWAEENGFSNITFLNLFARRSPQVSAIDGMAYEVLVGPRNDTIIKKYAVQDATLVLGWGGDLPVTEDQYVRRITELKMLLNGHTPHVVGALSYGRYPRHGRMWNSGNRDLREIRWSVIA